METPFWLDDWYVDPVAGSLHRDGAEVRLEPKVMTVLLVLAGRAGEVISREQIEELAWPGVVVGYDALASSIIKLRKALGDDSRHPRYIETVPKRGYRLIASVSHGGDRTAASAPALPPKAVTPNLIIRYSGMGLALTLAVFVVYTLWFTIPLEPDIAPAVSVVEERPS
ncbi:MAG: transcriptional regulator, partial [Granulosicoccaceae bacterium]